MIPQTALEPLQELAEQTLVHTVQLLVPVTVRTPGMKDVTSWQDDGDPQPGLAVPAEAGGVNVRADQQTVAGDWSLFLRKGAVVTAQHRAVVSWTDDNDVAWVKTLAVRKALRPRANELLTECIAVEVP